MVLMLNDTTLPKPDPAPPKPAAGKR
jgi:hypothetical protein